MKISVYELSVYELSCLWKFLSMNCPSMNCLVYEMSCLWIVLSMNCPVYEMSCLWIVRLWNVRLWNVTTPSNLLTLPWIIINCLEIINKNDVILYATEVNDLTLCILFLIINTIDVNKMTKFNFYFNIFFHFNCTTSSKGVRFY